MQRKLLGKKRNSSESRQRAPRVDTKTWPIKEKLKHLALERLFGGWKDSHRPGGNICKPPDKGLVFRIQKNSLNSINEQTPQLENQQTWRNISLRRMVSKHMKMYGIIRHQGNATIRYLKQDITTIRKTTIRYHYIAIKMAKM